MAPQASSRRIGARKQVRCTLFLVFTGMSAQVDDRTGIRDSLWLLCSYSQRAAGGDGRVREDCTVWRTRGLCADK